MFDKWGIYFTSDFFLDNLYPAENLSVRLVPSFLNGPSNCPYCQCQDLPCRLFIFPGKRLYKQTLFYNPLLLCIISLVLQKLFRSIRSCFIWVLAFSFCRRTCSANSLTAPIPAAWWQVYLAASAASLGASAGTPLRPARFRQAASALSLPERKNEENYLIQM